jgi:hypothetical protein
MELAAATANLRRVIWFRIKFEPAFPDIIPSNEDANSEKDRSRNERRMVGLTITLFCPDAPEGWRQSKGLPTTLGQLLF